MCGGSEARLGLALCGWTCPPLSASLGDREQLWQSGLLTVVDPDTAIRLI
jgi:hypothetical protein